MGLHRDKLGIGTLSLYCFALVFLSGCPPPSSPEVIGGRFVEGPAVSPDGKHIAYIARRFLQGKTHIIISRSDGTEEQDVAQDSSACCLVWSPDAQFIYFESDRQGQRAIYRIRSDGTKLKNISDNPANDESFDLSPNGREIVFTRSIRGKPKESVLIIASADGSNQRVLVEGGWRAQWSPDGRWILHKRSGDAEGAWIIHPDGSGERRIELDERYGWPLVWTPDSQAIFALVRGAHCNKYLCPHDLYLITLDGTSRKLVLQDVDGVTVERPRSFRCSWDSTGSRLALALGTYLNPWRKGIVIFDRQGSMVADFRPAPLSYGGADDVCWSPQSKTFFFTKPPDPGETPSGICAMNDDGSGERQVVPDNVVWSSRR